MKIQPAHPARIAELNSPRSRAFVVGRTSLFAIGLAVMIQSSLAQEPANKPAVVINRDNLTFVTAGPPIEIVREVVKTSKPTDLLLSVTAESSIITDVMTMGHDSSTAAGKLEVFLTVSQQPLPVPSGTPTPGTHADTAPVVFANRIYARSTAFADPTSRIRTYMETRHAAGFNWAVLNVGSGTWYIQGWAQYTESEAALTPGSARAEGVIGHRSLVVQPVKAEVRETIQSDTDPSSSLIIPDVLN